jgi:peptidoglycan L-alanyl-D-glutamate endopeptidase CwlK
MINSRKIDDLDPYVARLAKSFIAKAKKEGIDVLITSTFRDNESQNELYAQGRTKPGRIVTNAKAGQSFHNYRLAFDFVPIVNGKAQWNDLRTFKRLGELGESIGLEWAGRWKSFKELAHMQYTGGLSLAQLRAGKKPVMPA